jgi:hypothetical protein
MGSNHGSIGTAIVGFWALASAPTSASPISVDISSAMLGDAASGWELGRTDLDGDSPLVGLDSDSFDVDAGEYPFQIWGAGLGFRLLADGTAFASRPCARSAQNKDLCLPTGGYAGSRTVLARARQRPGG